MKKVLLLNQGHSSNLGDKLINEVMTNVLVENNEVLHAPFIPTEKESEIGWNDISSFRNKSTNIFIDSLKNIIKKSKVIITIGLDYKYQKAIYNIIKDEEIDAVVIGGGELLATFIPFNSALYSWIKIIKKNYKDIPIIIYGVSGTKPKNKFLDKRLKYILTNCNFISVRDHATESFINNSYKIKTNYSPDCVFSYRELNKDNTIKNKENILSIMIYDYDSLHGKLSFSNKIEYFDHWYDLLEKNIQCKDVVLLAYTTEEDRMCSKEFLNYILDNKDIKHAVQLAEYNDVYGLIDIVKKSRTIITGRMHAMILAKQYKTDIIPFIFKEKIETFCNEYVNVNFDYSYVCNINNNSFKLLNSVIKNNKER